MLVRKYNLGMDSHLKEFQDEIPPEVLEQMINDNEEIGPPQWFEKNGKSTFDVLDTYGINESTILDIISWDIFEKENPT